MVVASQIFMALLQSTSAAALDSRRLDFERISLEVIVAGDHGPPRMGPINRTKRSCSTFPGSRSGACLPAR
jgi:hypothetical protein